jgi:hypothetical protein
VWPTAQTPLAGLGIGKQRRKLAELRAGLHELDTDELAERRQVARIAKQRELHAAAFDEVRDHRRFCVKCVGDRRCREARTLDTRLRQTSTVLGAMMRGEL